MADHVETLVLQTAVRSKSVLTLLTQFMCEFASQQTSLACMFCFSNVVHVMLP